MVPFFKWLELTGEVNCHFHTNERSGISYLSFLGIEQQLSQTIIVINLFPILAP